MGFPDYKQDVIDIVGFKIRGGKKRVGWKDLGENENYTVHTYCGTKIRIGKEEDNVFKFCPRCMVKMKE